MHRSGARRIASGYRRQQLYKVVEMTSKRLAPANIQAALENSCEDLCNRLRVFVALNIPTGKEVLATARNFCLKPYYRFRANRLIRQFADELAAAPARYKQYSARLFQERINQSAQTGMLQSFGPYADAQSHLRELLGTQKGFTNRRWYQISVLYDWSDLEHSARHCINEWHRQIARCSLELCQDVAEAFVPQHFSQDLAADILDRVRRVKLDSMAAQPPVIIDGVCQRVS
jgi:hypothetical protein